MTSAPPGKKRRVEATEHVGTPLEPLTSAVVVLRSYRSSSNGREIETLPHVVDLVSSFLDYVFPDIWSVERACEHNVGVRMLKRLAAREESGVDPFYHGFLAGKGLVAAVRNDNLDVVRWICCEYCPSVVPVKAMVEAASRSGLRVLQWLFERYPSVRPTRFLAEKAVEGGHLDKLQWFLSFSKVSTEDTAALLTTAATHGHLKIMQWLYTNQLQLTGSAKHKSHDQSVRLVNAITYGHLDVARFLADQGCTLPANLVNGLCFRVLGGDLDMIKWLHASQLTDFADGWISEAATAGHLHIVKWLHENAPTASSSVEAMDAAARDHHLEVVQWLHANRTEGCSTYAMDGAAEGGHLEMVKWLHANRTEGCTTRAMNRASEGGHPEIVKWLHEHRTEGCTTDAMDGISRGGHLEVVKWLHANRTEGCTRYALEEATDGGHLETVKWLHGLQVNGAQQGEGRTGDEMDKPNSIPVLRWLYEHRASRCTYLAMVYAAQAGNFEKLLFLKERNLSECTREAMKVAMENGHFEIAQWLGANYPAVADMSVGCSFNHKALTKMFLQFETRAQ